MATAERNRFGALAAMTLLAAVAGGLVTLSHELSRDRIAANQRARLLARLGDVLGPVEYDNDLEASRRYVSAPALLGSDRPSEVFIATRDGAPVAAVISTVAPHGYSGPISLLVGVAADGSVTGVRVVAHRETPGLGDAIEIAKSPWITGFTGTSLEKPPLAEWRITKDGGRFDAITGATVTPRAVTEGVRNALLFVRDRRDTLFAPRTVERTDGSN